MKKQIRIYFEGGGDGRSGKDELRRAMDGFLKPLKDQARRKGCGWTLVCCGGRSSAWSKFQNAARSYPEETVILLVDSESEVRYSTNPIPDDGPKQHLRNRVGDGWETDSYPSKNIHLMVQCMETWLVADPDALSSFYGKGFNQNALPKRKNLEEEAKAGIYIKLDAATRPTSKGPYTEGKLNHSTKILPQVDSSKVCSRCPHAARFFTTIEGILGS
jgi:hypothetical protein